MASDRPVEKTLSRERADANSIPTAIDASEPRIPPVILLGIGCVALALLLSILLLSSPSPGNPVRQIGEAALIGLTLASLGLMARIATRSLTQSRRVTAANAALQQEMRQRAAAAADLQASEASFRFLAEHSLDIICRFSPEFFPLYVSPAVRPLLGYEPEEVLKMPPEAMIHPDDLEAVREHHEKLLSQQEPGPLVLRLRKRNGEYTWFESIGHAVVDPVTSQIREVHITSRDITTRREEEERLANLAEGLQAMVEATDELLTIPDERTLIRRAVELAREKLSIPRCAIFLDEGDGRHLRGTYGTDFEGNTTEEFSNVLTLEGYWRHDPYLPGPQQRYVVHDDQKLTYISEGQLHSESYRGWVAVTVISAGERDLGLLSCDSGKEGRAYDAVRQELLVVFCSILGTLIDRVRGEEVRRSAERRLRSIVENAPLMLYAVDASERVTLATGRAVDAITASGGDFRPGLMLSQTRSPVESVEGIRASLRGETSHEVVTHRGRSMEVWREPLYDDNGRVTGMLGVGIDVTERQLAEVARTESEARYRSVVENAREVIFRLDLQGHWVLLNPAWTEILGYSIQESLGELYQSFLAREDVGFAQREFDLLKQGIQPYIRMELRFQTKAGQVRWMDFTGRLETADGGQPTGITGTLSDISERHWAEEKLRATTTLQNAILNGASYAIFSCRPDGTLQTFNHAAERMFGYMAMEVVERRTPAFFCEPRELKRRAAEISTDQGELVGEDFEALAARARRGVADEFEVGAVRKDGSKFPLRLSLTALQTSDDELMGFVGIGYDLTEVKRVDRLKNEFISVVSHELRTPLTSIRGALGLLAGGVAGELPAKASEMVDIARKNSERLVLLINDILDIEKIENGQMRFDLMEVDLRQLAETAVEANRPYANGLGVNLRLMEPADDAPMVIRGDESRLMQVLTNLLSNASKFTPEGGLVTLKMERALVEGRSVARIAVDDEGPGVPEDFVPRLFEKFAQADSSSTRHKGGTGLGLAIARAIVEKHEGRIGYAPVRDTDKTGSSFFIELPLSLPFERKVEPEDQRPRILICEDDGETASLLANILDEGGFATEIATSLARARLALATQEFQGMTLDMILPDGDGADFLREIRQDSHTATLPVVIVTVKRDTGEISGDAVGVVDWLTKPIDAQRLTAAVRQFVSPNVDRPRVLHIEDDPDVRQITSAIVGTVADITAAGTLGEAREKLRQSHFHLAILDIGLPDGSGLDLLPLLNSGTPPTAVILFSAREPDDVELQAVRAALVKSRTSNRALLETIRRSLKLPEEDAIDDVVEVT